MKREQPPTNVVKFRRKKVQPSLTLAKPKPDVQPPADAEAEPAKKPKKQEIGKEVRLVAEIPERLHKLVKIRCLTDGIDIKDFVLAMLRKEDIY